jgi:two-component system response regulator RegA
MVAQGHTVLVVEDDEALRMLCRVNLELEGYRVLEAGNASAAAQLWRGQDVSVVLLDVHLGNDNGLELLARMRSAEGGPAVALLTGSVEVDAARRAAVEGVIQKPFTLDELTSTVERLAALGLR